MKKHSIITLSAIIIVLCLSSAKILQNNGIAGFTGSPGENTCVSCHTSFAANSGGGSITIATTPSITGNEYVPGTTYTVDVTVAKTGVTLFGLGAEILNSSNTNAGTISILNSTETKILTSSGRTNVAHQLNGGSSTTGSKTFSFKWVAPATAGVAKIYAAGVAANANSSNNGDYVYTTSLILSGSVGIKEQFEDVRLSIYPNPTTDLIHVTYALKEEAVVACELTSLTGAIIKQYFSESQAAGEQHLQLDVPSTVANGIYLLNLTVNSKKVSHRIIING